MTQKMFTMDRSMGGSQDADYAKALSTCESVDDLKALVAAYRPLVLDAVPVVEQMTVEDFTEFQMGLKKERRGQYAGDVFAAKFGAVLMPMPMLKITALSQQFTAPFGVTWHRVKELHPEWLQAEP